MIVKFFANKKGGSVAAIDYLLNKRVETNEAKVIVGNEELTRKLINIIQNKQKVTAGCISFEEKSIDEALKYQLMQEFEDMLLAGLQKEQYNILWVEHTDKNRLELNFVIPKIELTSKKALQPYYHKADLSRVETWQDLTNLKYNFTNPKDPSKSRSVNTLKTEIILTKNYESLDIELQRLVAVGKITSRDNLLNVIKHNNIEITRIGDEYISLKLPNSKKARRFKHDVYSYKFTSLDCLESFKQEQNTEIENFNNMDIEYEINRLSEKLQKYTVDKAIKNTNKYPLRAEIRSEMKQRLIFNQGDKKDDTTGNEIIKRIRAKREAKQRALQELEAERIGVQKLFANDSRRLASTIREFRDRYERWISRIRKSIKGVANEINKIKILEKYKNKFIEKYQQKQLHRQRM
jgi:hypothetical protein